MASPRERRDRRGRQLSIELPPELLLALRAEAMRRQQTTATLVRSWIDAGLRGAPAAAAGPAPSPLVEERLGALEARLLEVEAESLRRSELLPLEARMGALEAKLQPRTVPAATQLVAIDVGPPLQARPPAPPAAPPPAPAASPPQGAIPTADLADRLGVRRHALNERLRRLGGARVGLEVEGWRCVGQQAAAGGGPARWCWEPLGASGAET